MKIHKDGITVRVFCGVRGVEVEAMEVKDVQRENEIDMEAFRY